MDKREGELLVRIATAMERTNHDVNESLALWQTFVYELRGDMKAIRADQASIKEKLNMRDEFRDALDEITDAKRKLPALPPEDKHGPIAGAIAAFGKLPVWTQTLLIIFLTIAAATGWLRHAFE